MPFSLPHSHTRERDADGLFKMLGSYSGFDSASATFSLLSDPVRVKIFWLLSHTEQCVINIAAYLSMTSPAVSHHLKTLKEAGLIESRRDGKEVYYTASDSEKCRLLHKALEALLEISCPHGSPSGNEALARAAHELLLSQLSERITIDELSARLHTNPTTLKKAFRQVYGDSVAAHIGKHRMERAASLLSGTKKSVLEIARAVGYSSLGRFSSAFSEFHGVSPLEYRAQRANNI